MTEPKPIGLLEVKTMVNFEQKNKHIHELVNTLWDDQQSCVWHFDENEHFALTIKRAYDQDLNYDANTYASACKLLSQLIHARSFWSNKKFDTED